MRPYFVARQHYLADCENRRLKRGMWESGSYIAIRQGKARLVATYGLEEEHFARSWAVLSVFKRQRYFQNPQSKAAREAMQNAEFEATVRKFFWELRISALGKDNRGALL